MTNGQVREHSVDAICNNIPLLIAKFGLACLPVLVTSASAASVVRLFVFCN